MPSGARLSASLISPSEKRTLVVEQERTKLLAMVREALAGEDWIADRDRMGSVVDQLRRLQSQAAGLRASMLETGRDLIRLQELAGEGGYKALHLAGIVPIAQSTASDLRSIAAAVDAGRLPEDRLPRAVRAAAMAARLPAADAQRLVRQGVVGPGSTVTQMRALLTPPPVTKVERGTLSEHERKRLAARLKDIERIIAKLESERERIRRRLGQGWSQASARTAA